MLVWIGAHTLVHRISLRSLLTLWLCFNYCVVWFAVVELFDNLSTSPFTRTTQPATHLPPNQLRSHRQQRKENGMQVQCMYYWHALFGKFETETQTYNQSFLPMTIWLTGISYTNDIFPEIFVFTITGIFWILRIFFYFVSCKIHFTSFYIV